MFVALLPKKWAGSMERESRTWMARCSCGFERTIWEAGGIRWKAAERFASSNSAERVEQWNLIAVNLGRPGYPMAERFPVALATTYKHVDSRGLTTVFQVLEADEKNG